MLRDTVVVLDLVKELLVRQNLVVEGHDVLHREGVLGGHLEDLDVRHLRVGSSTRGAKGCGAGEGFRGQQRTPQLLSI